MVHIGWIQDTHTAGNGWGAQQALVEDYDYLATTKGVEAIYHGGDVAHTDNPGSPPHVEPGAYDRFFELINQTADPSLLKRLVPGNHDVPLSTFLAADERCVLRDRLDYPSDNLTVLFLNTQATGFVTGSAGANDQGGVGTEVVRVPYRDVQWLDREIRDARAQGHAVLVMPHAALTPIPSAPYDRVTGYRGQLDGKSLYNIVTNHHDVHGVLASHAADGANIVVPVSHLYQTAGEGNETIDGVHYVYKKHYVTNVTAANSDIHTFGEIRMDGSGADIWTWEHSNKTSTQILSVTF